MTQPQGVVVTLEQIYAEQQTIGKKVDALATKFEERSDHEDRIRALERRVWLATGAAAVLGGGIVQAINTAMGA